jgi:hypothetical protein
MTDPTGDEPIIHLAEGGKSPLPVGYTLERALQVLRDAGLTPARIEYPDGSIETIEEEAA